MILFDIMGEKIKSISFDKNIVYKTFRYKDYWIISTDNGYVNIYDNNLNEILT